MTKFTEQPSGNFDYVRDPNAFSTQLHQLARRVADLQRVATTAPLSIEVLESSMLELENSIEEMRVAQDEIVHQRGELSLVQDELEIERARYQELFEDAPDAYLVTNLVATIEEANLATEAILGQKRRFLIGKSLITLFESNRRDGFRDRLNRLIVHPCAAPQTWEMPIVLPGGAGTCEAEFTARRMPYASHQPDKLLWVIRDVTDRNRDQRIARQSERLAALGEMVATFAHESGNSLQRTQAALEMLATRIADQPAALKLVAEIQLATDDLSYLQKQIKDYAAPIVLERRPHDLTQTLTETVTALRSADSDRSIAVQEIVHSQNRFCEVDPAAMRQVFRNIVENSLAAAPSAAEIHVTWRDAEHQGAPALEVQLRDNGPGISHELRTKAFQPFFTTRTKGLGLGLAIVKRIVDAHGGTVRFNGNSEPGTCIEIVIPRGEV